MFTFFWAFPATFMHFQIKRWYAAYPVLDPFGMLLLEDGEMLYYKLTGTIDNTELKFYKIVKEDHEKNYADTKAMHYYSEIDDKSVVGNYLMGMPGNSELYELGEITLYTRMFRHSDDIRYGHKESATITIDPDPVRIYLAEKHPGYTFELTGDKKQKYYQVVPNAEISFHVEMDLFSELYSR